MSVRKHRTQVKAWQRYTQKIGPENYSGYAGIRAVDRWARAWNNNVNVDEELERWRLNESSGNR